MNRVLFLNLTAFSQTGGIERFNKCFLKALSELDKEKKTDSNSFSAYDVDAVSMYYDAVRYRGYGGRKLKFVLQSVLQARSYDLVVVGHINLAIIGVLIKQLFPSKKLFVVTHGIDVWGQLSGLKKTLLEKADKILSVSSFTKNKIVQVHGINPDKIQVFSNTIDPYFIIPDRVLRDDSLRGRYGFAETDFVIYTLTRLSSTELYKGYDKVLTALQDIVQHAPHIKYLVAGKYDKAEKERIDTLIANYGLQDNVTLAGFLDEKELVAHYQMADLYIMPSKKEGFGIVFIEALVCGLPVIAGNADGSVDALLNGRTGTLVNPDSVDEIRNAIEHALANNIRKDEGRLRTIRQETLDNYSFDSYKKRLEQLVAAV